MPERKNPYRVRPEANPDNRFESMQVEWEDGVELPQSLRIHKETARSIVTENDSPDIPFRYSVNPYRGCAHACAYCYARPSHEYLGLGAGTDFDTQIYAKVNAAELLRKKLASKSWSREPITFSGVTDCYQPAESQLKLTRACLEVCLEFGQPVSLITKSTLVLRDLDVLTGLGGSAGAAVVLSIPFADDSMARLVEPFAPPSSLRFKALEKLSAAGLRTGISLGPIIPGLNDSDIPALLTRAKEAGAAFAFYVMLRLPGATREVFLERIRERLPERAGKIEHHVRDVRGGGMYDTEWGTRMSGTGNMADMVEKLFRIHARKAGLEAGESLERLELRSKASLSAAPEARDAGPDARNAEPPQKPSDVPKPPKSPKSPKSHQAPKPPKAASGQLDLFSA